MNSDDSTPFDDQISPPVSRAEIAQSANDDRAPFSYADLRRFAVLLLGFGLCALLIRALADVLMLFVVSFFVAMVLNPFVSWLESKRVKRGLAVLFTMLALIGTVVGIGFLVVPPVVEQTTALVKQTSQNSESVQKQAMELLDRFPQARQLLPEEIRDAKKFSTISKELAPLIQKALRGFAQSSGPNVGKNVLATTLGLLGGLFTFVIGLLLIAFILGNPRPLVTGFLAAVPAKHRDAAGRSIGRIESQMLAWIRATLINGVITGVSTAVLLYFIDVKPVLVFGLLAFFGEFVPNLGPLAASIPALFVAAGMGTTKFLLTLAAILFVQQVESNVLVPFIMGRELDLHPVTIVFFAIAMGGLFGIAGAVLAVPLACVMKVLVDEFVFKPNRVPMDAIDARAEVLVKERTWNEA